MPLSSHWRNNTRRRKALALHAPSRNIDCHKPTVDWRRENDDDWDAIIDVDEIEREEEERALREEREEEEREREEQDRTWHEMLDEISDDPINEPQCRHCKQLYTDCRCEEFET